MAVALALALWLGSFGFALAQGTPAPQPVAPLADPTAPVTLPQPPPADQPGPQNAPPAFAPGLIDKLGDLIKGSVDSVSSNLKGTQQTIQDLNQGTVDTLSRLPVTGFATGRAVCARADNGAPDCKTASDKLCQGKGYKTGRGVDIETAENCNPRVFMPGYQRKENDCRTDNYVTRAACN
jgi:hypothetical protein